MKTSMEKTVKRQQDKIPSSYYMNGDEVLRLHQIEKTNWYDALMIAYVYGFIKGTRAKSKNRVSVL